MGKKNRVFYGEWFAMSKGKQFSIVVFGKKGYGKTTWIRYFIRSNPQYLYLIYDHFNDFYLDDNGAKYFPDSVVVHNINEYLQFQQVYNVKKGVFIFQGEIDYNDFFALCIAQQPCTCIFDEVDKACNPHFIDPDLKRIIHYGRHFNINLITAARRPHNVSRDLTSQADEMTLFCVTETVDIKYINIKRKINVS